VAENTDIIKKNTEALLNANKKVGLEVNPDETMYMLMSCYQKAGQKHSRQMANRTFEVCQSSNIWEQH
jgi:hypothetical protein